jgi:hypothetical protein
MSGGKDDGVAGILRSAPVQEPMTHESGLRTRLPLIGPGPPIAGAPFGVLPRNPGRIPRAEGTYFAFAYMGVGQRAGQGVGYAAVPQGAG